MVFTTPVMVFKLCGDQQGKPQDSETWQRNWQQKIQKHFDATGFFLIQIVHNKLSFGSCFLLFSLILFFFFMVSTTTLTTTAHFTSPNIVLYACLSWFHYIKDALYMQL